MLEAFWQSVQVFILARFHTRLVQFWSKFRAILDSAYFFVADFGKNPSKVAQCAHFGISGYFTFLAYVIGWVFGPWYAGLAVGAAFLAFALYKEPFMDTKPPESAPFWPSAKTKWIDSGLCDLEFYVLGVLSATGIAAAIGMAFPR